MAPSDSTRLTTANETAAAAELAFERASGWLAALDERKVLPETAHEALEGFGGPLPETGSGAVAAVEELAAGLDAATASPGPRFFHFVTGGVTPAALGADWLATALDQNAFSWVGSPLGTRLETVAVEWLKQLFDLPAGWGGALTTGATAANFTGLAAARQWWGEQHGRRRRCRRDGRTPAGSRALERLHPPERLEGAGDARNRPREHARVLAGRDGPRRPARPGAGAPGPRGAPAIVVGNAGEVNAGEFDPIDAFADLSEQHGAWLHVDGAFGLFARVSPRSAPLAEGVQRADSVIADGHKWLNVPYDCGFAFVRDSALLAKVFSLAAAYLPGEEPEPTYGYLTPELLAAGPGARRLGRPPRWGRSGYREMVERHLDLAQRLAGLVDEAPELERLADVPLNIVCFRYRPRRRARSRADALNAAWGRMCWPTGASTSGRRASAARSLSTCDRQLAHSGERHRPLVEVVLELGARSLLAQSSR